MVYQKRDRWCFRDKNGRLYKFVAESEALAAAGEVPAEPEELEIEYAYKNSYEIDEPIEE